MNEQQSRRLKDETCAEPCWIVWEAASDGGRPYLLAVDTSEEQAALHVRARKEAARMRGEPPPMLRVEESWLDHLYGESMTRSFDEAKKMAREVQRARIAELHLHLRRAIELAREAWHCLDRTTADLRGAAWEVHELEDLAKILPPDCQPRPVTERPVHLTPPERS